MRALVRCLVENREVLAGVAALRRLGEQADDAVTTVLAVRDLRRLRASWELWASLLADRDDPEALLLQALPQASLDAARFALWGDEASPRRDLRVVANFAD